MENIKLLNLKNIYLLFIVLLFLFGRVFTGLYIYSFRLGEIMIGLALVILIINLIKSLLNYKQLSAFEKRITLIFILVIAHLLYLFLSKGYEFFDLYPFKTSSYISVVGFFYLGKNLDLDYEKKIPLSLMFAALLMSYFSSIFGISNTYQDRILKYTDKFDYLKASDLIIFFIFFAYFFIKSEFSKNIKLKSFLLSFAIFYLPLMMHKSRGASIAFIIFILFLIYEQLKVKYSHSWKLGVIATCCILFVSSTFIVSKSPVELEEVSEKVIYVSTSRYEKPVQNTPQIYDEYPLLYFENYRAYSSDGNMNWRLQIWQDVFADLASKNSLLSGYGYNDKIPAMELDFRSGNDGTNENVHNFFVNMIARGGFIHATLFIFFFIAIYKKALSINNLKIFFMIFIPLIFTSFFDASMENAHYPLLFYYLLGNIVKSEN
jgi:hypothetical protein